MTQVLTPKTPADLAEAVCSLPRVLAVGAQTKPRLAVTGAGAALISTKELQGIIEYEPEEFTFTALAGTAGFVELAPGRRIEPGDAVPIYTW